MNRYVLGFVVVLGATVALLSGACGSAPTYKVPLRGIAYSGNQSPIVCLSGLNFRAKENSFISWHAMKIAAMGNMVPLTGKNTIIGGLNIKNKSWNEASSTIDFVSSSTDSEDPIRDARINSFVFGVPEALPFRFKVTKITGEDLSMKIDESRNVVVQGRLSLGDQTTEIEMPALIKHMPDLISITPASLFKLNVRVLSPTVNGVNLVDKISQLLSFVPGVDMQDEVTIDFNLEFEPSCLD